MSISQHSRPLWLGFLACILFVPVVMGIVASFSAYSLMIPPLLVVAAGLSISIVTTLLCAVPLVLWLRRRCKLNAILLCTFGAIGGALAMAIFIFYNTFFPEIRDRSFAIWSAARGAVRSMPIGACYGLLSAAALCIGAGITIRPSGRAKKPARR